MQALLAAKDVIHEPFAIINADDYYGRESYAICADHLEQIAASGDTQAACMVGYRLKNTISYNGTVNRGICRTEGGKLSGVTETYQIMPLENGLITSNYGKEDGQLLAGDSIVSMNFWGFQPSIFTEAQTCFDRFIRSLQPDDLTSEYVLPTMVDDLIRADRIHVEVLPCDCTWMGITYPSDP